MRRQATTRCWCPSVDRDGNDVPGVRAPMVAAPLGTYTGWNLRARGHGHGSQYRFEGSYIPFPESPAGAPDHRRSAAVDPGALSRQGGLCRGDHRGGAGIGGAGLMLEEDVARCAEAAADWGRPRHDVTLD